MKKLFRHSLVICCFIISLLLVFTIKCSSSIKAINNTNPILIQVAYINNDTSQYENRIIVDSNTINIEKRTAFKCYYPSARLEVKRGDTMWLAIDFQDTVGGADCGCVKACYSRIKAKVVGVRPGLIRLFIIERNRMKNIGNYNGPFWEIGVAKNDVSFDTLLTINGF